MATLTQGDHLCLSGNTKVRKLLKDKGENKPTPEKVLFSDFVIKINRKGKEQTRTILVTDKAIYNLMHNNYGKCQRRIGVNQVEAITSSTASDEFVLHVPDEYDYRYKSSKKEQIVTCLRGLKVAHALFAFSCMLTFWAVLTASFFLSRADLAEDPELLNGNSRTSCHHETPSAIFKSGAVFEESTGVGCPRT
jgi:hypothetical protein